MTNIIFDVDEIIDIKNKLEYLIQSSQKIESGELKKLVKQKRGILDDKEKIVFKYIKENQGKSKQDIVNDLQGIKSRGPVFKAIKSLIKYGMIIPRPDDNNPRILRLYVNKESLMIATEAEINAFKKSYFKLIKRANEEYHKKQNLTEEELMKSKRPHIDIPDIYSSGVADDLSKIFKQLIMSYSLLAIFEWPKQIKDFESRNRLNLMVFQSLNEIFSELVKRTPFDIKNENKKIDYLREGLHHSYEDVKRYADMVEAFHEYGLDTEFDLVMSDLFTASKMPMKWEDYRTR